MNVYVLTKGFEGKVTSIITIVGVFDHYNKAFSFAEEREGRHFNWVLNNKPDGATSWSGKATPMTWFEVQEFEVITS